MIQPMTKTNAEFAVWKTIKLGVGPRSGEGLLRAILAAGFDEDAGNASSCLKRHFAPHPKEEEVDLVALEMHQVGYFPSGIRANDLTARAVELDGIYRWAEHVGLDLCPMEVGPQLRLAYKNQPMSEDVLIAMEPLALSTRTRDQIFVVWHGLGWDSSKQSRTRVTKALDLTHATPFRYWSESSCIPGCERLPGMPETTGGRLDTRRMMVFVKPRKQEQ